MHIQAAQVGNQLHLDTHRKSNQKDFLISIRHFPIRSENWGFDFKFGHLVKLSGPQKMDGFTLNVTTFVDPKCSTSTGLVVLK